MSRRTGEERVCEYCGTVKYFGGSQLAHGEGHYCSRRCKHAAATGKLLVSPGHRYIRRDGYVWVYLGLGKWQLEHRLVAEEVLGRTLETQEHVHHINGDKADNRPENLRVMGNTEHQKLHEHLAPFMVRSRITLTCRGCGNEYETWPFKAETSHYCSHACRMTAMHQARREQAAARRL